MHLRGYALNISHVLHHLQVPYSHDQNWKLWRFCPQRTRKLGIKHHAYSQEENGYCLYHINISGERSFQAIHEAEYLFDLDTFLTLSLQDYS